MILFIRRIFFQELNSIETFVTDLDVFYLIPLRWLRIYHANESTSANQPLIASDRKPHLPKSQIHRRKIPVKLRAKLHSGLLLHYILSRKVSEEPFSMVSRSSFEGTLVNIILWIFNPQHVTKVFHRKDTGHSRELNA